MNDMTRFKWLITIALVVCMSGPVAFGRARHLARRKPAGDVSAMLVGSTRTLLPDGKLLIVGGEDAEGGVQDTIATENLSSGQTTRLGTRLSYPRAGHTATVLPDGAVLVLGGVGKDGKLVPAEVIDPSAQAVKPLGNTAPAPRAFHTATVLTDGRVLIAGGIFADGSPATAAELWDPRGKKSLASVAVTRARRNHTATLMADGRVLLAGGDDKSGNPLGIDEILDPQTQSVVTVEHGQATAEVSGTLAEMRASSPEDGAQNVPLDALVSVRFSRPVQMASINADTVALRGSNGSVLAKIVAAEGGRLAFITPSGPLATGTVYRASISGAVDSSGQGAAYSEFSFTTEGDGAGLSSSYGEEDWSPSPTGGLIVPLRKWSLFPISKVRAGRPLWRVKFLSSTASRSPT